MEGKRHNHGHISVNRCGKRATPTPIQRKELDMEIKRVGIQASAKGPADWFTGTVRIDPLFQANALARASGASVTFEPGGAQRMAHPSARSDAYCHIWGWLGVARGWTDC